MRTKLPILLTISAAFLLSAGTAQAVSLGDFTCAGDTDSRLCEWGEDNLSAELSSQRRGRAVLQLDLSGREIARIQQVAVGADGLEIRRVRQLGSSGRYRIDYRGSFDDLVAHIRVGVDMMTYNGRRARFTTAQIPEPAAATVFAIGALVIGLRTRRS